MKKDDIKEILKIDDIEELKKQIRDYFGILETKEEKDGVQKK